MACHVVLCCVVSIRGNSVIVADDVSILAHIDVLLPLLGSPKTPPFVHLLLSMLST